MKHVKRRFLFETDTNSIEFQSNVISYELDEIYQLKKVPTSAAFLITEDGIAYSGFAKKINGRFSIFPIPDITLIHFNTAQTSVRNITSAKKELLFFLSLNDKATGKLLNSLYQYYSLTSTYVISLFTSIESFINQMIPEDYEYRIIRTNKTEIYNKRQIQKSIDFKTKISKVMSDACKKKDFFAKKTKCTQMIWQLKEFRDELIHTKHSDDPIEYKSIIQRPINFNYTETLKSVAQFMNHYKSEYIVECDCGEDF